MTKPLLLALAAAAAAALSATLARAAQLPVFCSDVGLAFEFEFAEGSAGAAWEREPLASSCLRHAAMHAAGAHLSAQMDAFAVSAVDCAREAPAAVERRFAVFSLCSRANVQRDAASASVKGWDADVRKQIDAALGSRAAKHGVAVPDNGGVRWFPRLVQLSLGYTLPDGKGMPRFEFRGAKITLNHASGAVTVELSVHNSGKVPLHLYRVTVVESPPNAGARAEPSAVVAVLPSVAAVDAGKSTSVVFTSNALSQVKIAAAKTYILYISHSGFRSHQFEGVLDSDGTFVPKTPVLSSVEKSNELYGALTPSDAMDPLLSSFPLGSWRVFSVSIVVVVGLAAALYARRRRPRMQLRDMSQCLQRSMKQSSGKSNVRAASTPTKKVQETGGDWKSRTSDMDMHTDAALDREMDELESAGLITPPVMAARQSKARQSLNREKMPAIQMQWKPPASTTNGRFRRPLDLDKDVQLDPKRFENLWEEYLQRFQSNEVLNGRVDSTAILDKMQTLGVLCMASGTISGVEKYVFYAKQRESAWYFFLVVEITLATRSMGITVRTSSDASDVLVEEFVQVFKTAMQDAIVKQVP